MTATAARTAANYLRQCGNEVISPENEDDATAEIDVYKRQEGMRWIGACPHVPGASGNYDYGH